MKNEINCLNIVLAEVFSDEINVYFSFSLFNVDWQYQIWKWGVIFTDNVSRFRGMTKTKITNFYLQIHVLIS